MIWQNQISSRKYSVKTKRDHLKGIQDYYDVVVIGSGLGGLTGATVWLNKDIPSLC